MADNTLRAALDSARAQLEGAEAEVARLKTDLREAVERKTHLERVISALEDFLDDAAVLTDYESEVPDETPDESPREMPRQPTFEFEQSTPVRKKWPSTAMVGELVNDLGRAVHRDEVVGLFNDRYGIPPTWENPRNTLGNALLRAWERGLIERLDPDYFAPRGHEVAMSRGGQ